MTAAPAPQQAPAAQQRPPGQARKPDVALPVGGAPTRLPGPLAKVAALPTPKLLRLLLACVILFTTLFGVAAGTVLLGAQNRMAEAVRNTDQLLRVQTIRAEMLRADATLSNSFLLGGQEQASQQQAYQQALENAEQLVVEAAEAQPADRTALVRVNAGMGSYARTMEQARDNNRQGFPVGQAYLTEAGTELRTGILPILDSLVNSNSVRVADQTEDAPRGWIVFSGLLALGFLVLTMVVIASRFRRLFNPGLVAATVLVLAGLMTASMTLTNNATTMHTVNSESLATAQAAATARAQASDAKVYENLTLIARSGGGRLEQSWADASWETRYALRRVPDAIERERLTGLWDQHSFVHLRIRTADAAGRWDDARDLATNSEPNGSNMTFGRFDTEITKVMTDSGVRAATSLRNQRGGLIAAAVLSMLAALAAIAGAVWGVRTRLKEYA
ncbi:hypothetical protein CGZ98_19155 [Enemella evansiae]|uniref:hypothetical protein n=1 Tax=Enemella evansiae TaxID=2016499 RepID=UPI000B96E89F|nr:hypothetical protein [Enemella evansiae]OYO07558.1 hypothetical protein CGZ98_19155 [Enemella evansiae]